MSQKFSKPKLGPASQILSHTLLVWRLMSIKAGNFVTTAEHTSEMSVTNVIFLIRFLTF